MIPPNLTTAAREELRATNKVETFDWDQYQHTGRIAVNIGATVFESWAITELDDPDEGLNGVDIRQLYDHVMTCFATIFQREIDENMETFHEGMEPSKILAVYIRKQEQ